MDGTQSAYYYGGPPEGESTIWVIHLKGGGGCDTRGSCKTWQEEKGSNSTFEPKRLGTGTLSSQKSVNPDFYNAHHVFVPYCTGDTHKGQATKATGATFGWIFEGHVNFKIMIHHLLRTQPLAGATDVLLQGASAGGIGVLNKCDFLQDYLTELGVQATVKCSPQGGFYYPGNAEDNPNPDMPPTNYGNWPRDHDQLETIPHHDGATHPHQPFVPEPEKACLAEKGVDYSAVCGLAAMIYKYSKRPMFVMEDQFDTSKLFQLGLPKPPMLGGQNALDYIAYYGRAMRATADQVKTGDGFFLASCFDHVASQADTPSTTIPHPIMGNVTGLQALGTWFFNKVDEPIFLVDDCDASGTGLPCNPTCTGVDTTPLTCSSTLEDLCAKSGSCTRCTHNNMDTLELVNCTTEEIDRYCDGHPNR